MRLVRRLALVVVSVGWLALSVQNGKVGLALVRRGSADFRSICRRYCLSFVVRASL